MNLSFINWNIFLGVLKLVSVFIGLKTIQIIFDKISNNKKIIEFFKKKNTKEFITSTKSFFGSIISTIFVMTVIGGVIVHISDPEKFPNFTVQLAIAGLTFGGISIAMATLLNDTDSNKKLSDQVIRYKHLTQDFVISSIYLIFAYFFGLVLEFSTKETSNFFYFINHVYSISLFFALLLGVVGIISGIWKLLTEMNDY